MAQKNTDIKVKSDIEAAVVETAQPNIESLIYVIRGKQVMMDSDLAMLYQVETGNLNKYAICIYGTGNFNVSKCST